MIMKEVLKHINQVRMEMRFYSSKEIPNYCPDMAKETVDRLQNGILIYSRRLRFTERDVYARQKLVRELEKLKHDLKVFRKETAHMSLEKDQIDINKVPVLKPLNQLCDILSTKPIKRNY